MAKRRRSLLSAFKEIAPPTPTPPRGAGARPNAPGLRRPTTGAARSDAGAQRADTSASRPTANTSRPELTRIEVRADEAIPVRPAPPITTPRPTPRASGTHADLPPPGPPLSRARLLLLSVVGAAILLTVIVVMKFVPAGENVEAAPANGAVAARVQPDAQSSAPPTSQVGPPQSSAPRNALEASAGATDFDRAFQDPKNRFTVRLAQLDNDANGVQRAREAYKHLYAEGLHVVQPIVSGNGEHIFLCADAKPKKDDLVVVCEYIKRLRGPGGQKTPYHDAYIENIDRLLKR